VKTYIDAYQIEMLVITVTLKYMKSMITGE